MLTEYNLLEFLQQWLDTGTFPNKQTWKIIVNQAFNQRHRTLRQSRISADPGFSRFLAIFQEKDPAKFWRFPTNCYEISQCKFICKLISDQPYKNLDTCQLCGAILYDFFTHVTCSCSVTYAIRNAWWSEISNLFSVYLCSELCALSYDDLFLILLGRKTCAHLDENNTSNFQKLNYHLVLDCASLYYRTLYHKSSADNVSNSNKSQKYFHQSL